MRKLLIFILFLFCFIASAHADQLAVYPFTYNTGNEVEPDVIDLLNDEWISIDSDEYFSNDLLAYPKTEPGIRKTVQTDAVSMIVWQKCLGGSSSEVPYCISHTADGGYIVAGRTASNNGNVTGNHGSLDYWVVKTSGTGEIVWEKCLGGSKIDDAKSIITTDDGGYIIAGYSGSKDGDVSGGHGSNDYWIVKLSGIGEIEWQKCLGGSSTDCGWSILKTGDDGYIVAGWTLSDDGNVTGNHGDRDSWVVKLSGSGEITWEKCFGGTASDEVFCIVPTADGGYIMAGDTDSDDGDVTGNHGGFDYWVVKLTDVGEMEWQKCLGGTGDDFGHSISQTDDGGCIVTGLSESNDGDVSGNHGDRDYWVVKLTDSGEMEWQKCLGGTGTDEAKSVIQTDDWGYIIVGGSESNDGDVSGNHGDADFWVVKLTDSGEMEWQKCLGGSESEVQYSISRTADGGYIVAGWTLSDDGDVSGNHGLSDYWIVQMTEVLDPVASFNADPTHGIAPLLVQFLDTSTGSPASWNWTFDDGSTGSDQNPLHEFIQPGSYNVSLTVSNAAGSNTSYMTIPVLDPEAGMYLALEPGWNLVSVPLYPAAGQDAIGTLFGGIGSFGHSIFMFNATAQSWDVPLASHMIAPLEAYFVYSGEPVEITVTYADVQLPPVAVLSPTWNQMGYSGILVEEAGSYLSPLEDAWTFILGFDAVNQRYEETIIRGGTGPYSDSRQMYPGKGYWLYSEEEIPFYPSS